MQIGKLLGAKVVAVARGNEKCALLSQLGADLVVDSVPAFLRHCQLPVHSFIGHHFRMHSDFPALSPEALMLMQAACVAIVQLPLSAIPSIRGASQVLHHMPCRVQ